ncbi:probable calcium-binding protein CML46 [Andrographis paniculata]|uniref:probable calcium-binding protein CML46 n=1 Tax=Andrographis paniculata TaxID=175694 RepID=UPI0021E96B26|nr:probable calcium-binding protein CML46 [Andrographis paniculata]
MDVRTNLIRSSSQSPKETSSNQFIMNDQSDQFQNLQLFPFNLNLIVPTILFIDFLAFHFRINGKGIRKWFAGFIESSDELVHARPRVERKEFDLREDRILSRGEVEIALRCLGMSCDDDDDSEESRFDGDDLYRMFEDENPTIDELRSAFHVFDENRDGFIDAEELNKVLTNLQLIEGSSEIDACKLMIRAFDEDGDGRIDLCEFVKLMEI